MDRRPLRKIQASGIGDNDLVRCALSSALLQAQCGGEVRGAVPLGGLPGSCDLRHLCLVNWLPRDVY